MTALMKPAFDYFIARPESVEDQHWHLSLMFWLLTNLDVLPCHGGILYRGKKLATMGSITSSPEGFKAVVLLPTYDIDFLAFWDKHRQTDACWHGELIQEEMYKPRLESFMLSDIQISSIKDADLN